MDQKQAIYNKNHGISGFNRISTGANHEIFSLFNHLPSAMSPPFNEGFFRILFTPFTYSEKWDGK
jgi:hypothetical protein